MSQSNTPAADAADVVSGGDGLAVGAEGDAHDDALAHGEWVARPGVRGQRRPRAPRRRRRLTAYPAASVLPSGLKATLLTPPSLTRRAVLAPRRRRAATSQSTTPPPLKPTDVSCRECLAVGAEGHARDAPSLTGSGSPGKALAAGDVPEHHAAAAVAVANPAASVLPSGLKATVSDDRPSETCKKDVRVVLGPGVP